MISISNSLKEVLNSINNAYASFESLFNSVRTPYIVNVSNVNIDLTNVNIVQGTIILQGTQTANITITLKSDVREYKIINNVTGSYYATITTATGTGYNTYPRDRIELYCDGTNVDICGGKPANVVGVERKTAESFGGYAIYQKTIDTGALPNAGARLTAHGISGNFTLIAPLAGMAFGPAKGVLSLQRYLYRRVMY